ncbi:hypothetical protein [Streptomyces sp. NPDC093544]|uniref:hypothetical protein n=1 Tax=Streptomyces sp. NPDC093544 TaxID=3155200 RepID=UPI00342E8597
MNNAGLPPPTTRPPTPFHPVVPVPPPYRGGGLIPPAGPARTWGLGVVGVSLLFVLVGGLAAGSDPDETGTAGSPWEYTEPATDYTEPTTPDIYSTPDTASTPGTTESGGVADAGGLFGEPTDGATATGTAVAAPEAVVTAYFEAINNRDYPTAWDLGGRNLETDYTSFVAGYSTTEHDTISIVSVQGDVVQLVLDALETDGTSRSYDVTYTVLDGVITDGTATPTT